MYKHVCEGCETIGKHNNHHQQLTPQSCMFRGETRREFGGTGARHKRVGPLSLFTQKDEKTKH